MQKRSRNQRGEGGRLKAEIIEAAMRLLDSHPVSELSLRTVAREAGIAPPSIYAHFPDAKTMIMEIVQECWRQMGDQMAQAAKDSGTTNALIALQAQMAAYVRYAMERSSRYQLLFAFQPIDVEHPDLRGLVRPAYRNVMTSVEAIVAEGGMLPTGDAVSAAMLTLSLVHGRIALAHLAPMRTGNSTASVEAFVTETLGRVFAPQPVAV